MREATHTSTELSIERRAGSIHRMPGVPLFALCMLLLGFAVVCWGLHDKLSLYSRAGAHAPIAKAKLLTERERPAAQAAAAEPQSPAPVAAVGFLLFAVLVRLLFGLRPRGLAGEPLFLESSQTPPLSEALRRRPPPSMVSTPACAASGFSAVLA